MMLRCVVLALGSLAMAVAAHAQDVLVIRDGTRRQGVVAGCRDDACTLDGAKVARGLIAWVGLRQDDAAPPPVRDPLKDEAHLVDGRVVTGEFGGLSLGAVAIGDSSFDRDEVAWIRFAGPEPAPTPGPSPRGPIYRFSPSPPAASPPGPSPPPTPPPSMPPPPPPPPSEESPRPPGSPPPPGSLACDPRQGMVRGSGVMWTGTARVRQSMRGPGYVYEDTADFEVKLRESCEAPVLDISVTPHRRIGTVVYLDSGGTVQRDSRREEQTGSCLCEGRRSYTGPSGQGGAIGRRTGPGDTSGSLGFDLPSQPSYWLEITSGAEIIEAPCRGEYCGGISSRSLLPLNAGRHPHTSPALGWDPELRSPEGGIMRGSWTKPVGPATLSATWSICRQGVRCPPPPDLSGGGGAPSSPSPSPSPDPCGSLDSARAQVDVLWAERQSRAPALQDAWRELEAAHQELLFNNDAWQVAVSACGLQQILRTLVSRLGGEYTKAMELMRKIATGDLSYLVQTDEMKIALRVIKAAFAVAGANDPANMRRMLSGCSVPEDLRRGALAFVENYEKVARLMPVVQELISYINQKDQLYWEEWNRYYRVCLEYADCKGLPPSTCPQPPESPSGPMPQ